MRWFHRKVAGHPTRYEQECMAYNWAKHGRFIAYEAPGTQWVWGSNPRAVRKLEFTNEFLGEPIPPEAVERHVIPRSRSVGKSEDIRRLPSRLVRDSSEGWD